MDKDLYHQFFERYRNMAKVTEQETRKLSLKDKLQQMTALMSFFTHLKKNLREDKYSINHWALLKSKI